MTANAVPAMPLSPDKRITSGDIFSSGAHTLVNAVNCQGVMGAGIAKAFRARFPLMHADYQRRCAAGLVRLGEPYIWREEGPLPEGERPWVCNFPTKDHWRERSRLAPIEEGLRYLAAHYREWGVLSLAVPALGCGLGGLPWATAQAVLIEHLRELDIPVLLYRPGVVTPAPSS